MAGRLWPAALVRAALAAVTLPFLGSGCGGSHAPCPTPTTLLDAHRSESEALQEDLARSEAEEEELRTKREEAVRRIEEAEAEEDSSKGARKGRSR